MNGTQKICRFEGSVTRAERNALWKSSNWSSQLHSSCKSMVLLMPYIPQALSRLIFRVTVLICDSQT